MPQRLQVSLESAREYPSNLLASAAATDSLDSLKSSFITPPPIDTIKFIPIPDSEDFSTTETHMSCYDVSRLYSLDAALHTRRWVLQERLLAPRTVHFSKEQMFWELRASNAGESYPEGIPKQFSKARTKAWKEGEQVFFNPESRKIDQEIRTPFSALTLQGSDDQIAISSSEVYNFWSRTVEHYMANNGTNASGKLTAIAGLAHKIAKTTKEQDLTGLWHADSLPRMLVNFTGARFSWQNPFEAYERHLSSTLSYLSQGGKDVKSHGRKRPSSTQWMVPLVLAGASCDALGDYGLDENAVTLEKARHLDMRLDLSPDACEDFVAGNNKPFRSIGKAYATCSFPMVAPQTLHEISFHVFKQLPEPLVIGRRDLEATGTLANHGYRLVEKAFDPRAPMKVMAFHRPGKHLQATLNGLSIKLLADTGAQMNLAQPQFAAEAAPLSGGFWEVDFWVQFADCSFAHVGEAFDGAVKPISLDGESHDMHNAPFYVCDELFCPAILGASSLVEMDAFRKLQSCFAPADSTDHLEPNSSFNLIVQLTEHERRLLEYYTRLQGWMTGSSNVSQTAAPAFPGQALSEATIRRIIRNEDDAEQARRLSENRRIMQLQQPEQQAAKDEEERQRQRHDQSINTLLQVRRQRVAAEQQAVSAGSVANIV